MFVGGTSLVPVGQLRASLLAEQVNETMADEHPTCPECGIRMAPRTQKNRRMVLGTIQHLLTQAAA